MKSFLAVLSISSLLLLTACTDFLEDDDDTGGGTEYFGYFLDSGVEGLSYTPNSGFEWTEGNGRFFYTPGESTSFSILGLTLGSTAVDSDNPVVTPATLLGEGSRSRVEMEDYLNEDSDNAQTIKNQLVLLQTLDFDQNPDNGIYLPKASEIDPGNGTEVITTKNALSDLDLTLDTSDFADALEAKLVTFRENGTVNQTSVVISETDAVAHFLETLENLESVGDFIGRWGMRSGGSGDVSAIYTFNSNLGIKLIEYDDCPGDLYGASEATLIDHCTPVEINQTFSTNGTQLILENDDISDTCVTLSADSHEIFASCNFQGSGLGSEIIRLQRAPLAFNSNALHSQYTELVAGDGVTTSFNFDLTDNTGDYTYTGEATEDITWRFINDGQDLELTVISDSHIDELHYKGFVKGSWLTNLDDTSNVKNILRNVENTTNATLLKTSGFFGVFDITPGSTTEGQCKEVRYAQSQASNQVTHKTYNNDSGNTYSCDYPDIGSDEQNPLAPNKEETFTINSSYIESTISGDDRRCYLLGVDDYEIDNLYVACEKSGNHNVFEIELWRGL